MTSASTEQQADRPLHVVSVSLGSSTRDEAVEVSLGGRQVTLERRGVDGDLRRAVQLVAELDGQVDAIGLGGTDLYIHAGGRRYVIREAARIAAAAKRTPILDGSGLKNTLEREAIRRIDDSGQVPLADKRALLVCAVDRFGMAEALWERCAAVTYGDLMFGLGLPLPIRSLAGLRRIAPLALPIVVRLPLRRYYPVGQAQTTIEPRFGRAYAEADVIAGDFHLIRRRLPPLGDPPPLRGKVVLTNTTTAADVELLRERGLETLVTTTPRFGTRSFGTNVLEACFTALAGSSEPLPPERLMAMLDDLGWSPSVTRLSDGSAAG